MIIHAGVDYLDCALPIFAIVVRLTIVDEESGRECTADGPPPPPPPQLFGFQCVTLWYCECTSLSCVRLLNFHHAYTTGHKLFLMTLLFNFLRKKIKAFSSCITSKSYVHQI